MTTEPERKKMDAALRDLGRAHLRALVAGVATAVVLAAVLGVTLGTQRHPAGTASPLTANPAGIATVALSECHRPAVPLRVSVGPGAVVGHLAVAVSVAPGAASCRFTFDPTVTLRDARGQLLPVTGNGDAASVNYLLGGGGLTTLPVATFDWRDGCMPVDLPVHVAASFRGVTATTLAPRLPECASPNGHPTIGGDLVGRGTPPTVLGARQGVPYPFEVKPWCGATTVVFDGRVLRAVPPLPASIGPAGTARRPVEGTLELTSAATARFSAPDGTTLVYAVATGAPPPPLCS